MPEPRKVWRSGISNGQEEMSKQGMHVRLVDALVKVIRFQVRRFWQVILREELTLARVCTYTK